MRHPPRPRAPRGRCDERSRRRAPRPGRTRYGGEAQPRMGFFTDTTRLHRLQGVRGGVQGVERGARGRARCSPATPTTTPARSARTPGGTSRSSSRTRPLRVDDDGEARRRATFRWLMSSDVCKHCTHAACLDVCPTGAIIRTEFGTVVVQEDVCNGCGYCVPACPFGVHRPARVADDGRVWKCTLCYDRTARGHRRRRARRRARPSRSSSGRSTSCASARPTGSRQVAGRRARGRPPLRRGPGRRRRRLRRVLPAARRARGVRPAARPGRHDPRPARDVAVRRARRGGAARASRLWPP